MERWVLLRKGAKCEELSEKSKCHRRGSDGEVSSWNDFRSV